MKFSKFYKTPINPHPDWNNPPLNGTIINRYGIFLRQYDRNYTQ